MPEQIERKVNQLFSIPNNEEGAYFLYLTDKYLNHDSYGLKRRGRTMNHAKVKKAKENPRQYQQHVPLKYADNLGVYLTAKTAEGEKTIGINDALYAEKYRHDYYNARERVRELEGVIARIHRDVLPFMQTAVEDLAIITGYGKGVKS
jgi:hypothetical protein